MDVDDSATEYLTPKEFLTRNPCVKLRTFTRWKQSGLIDFIQPGGPNTAILVPADALERIQQRRGSDSEMVGNSSELRSRKHKTKSVRQPDWKRQINSNTKDKNAKEE